MGGHPSKGMHPPRGTRLPSTDPTAPGLSQSRPDPQKSTRSPRRYASAVELSLALAPFVRAPGSEAIRQPPAPLDELSLDSAA
jgi:hypothetical protein